LSTTTPYNSRHCHDYESGIFYFTFYVSIDIILDT
jgi:hypothetical protein